MADVATPSAISMANADPPMTSGKDKAAPVVKPERPDEEQYKTDLAKAEKELNASNERMVSRRLVHTSMIQRDSLL